MKSWGMEMAKDNNP